MKVFITGGTGFVGNALILKMLNLGWEVTGIYRGTADRVQSLPSGVSWINSDLFSINENYFRDNNLIIHAASFGVPPKSGTFEDYFQQNVLPLYSLSQSIVNLKIPYFVNIGSCHEYGLSANSYEFIPEYAPLKPIGTYAVSKVLQYYYLKSYFKNTETKFLNYRLFNAYGEAQHHENLFPSLVSAIKSGDDFVIKNANLVRDFISIEKSVEKIISSILTLVEGAMNTSNYISENVGTGIGQTIYEFAQSIWKEKNAKGRLIIEQSSNQENYLQRIVAKV